MQLYQLVQQVKFAVSEAKPELKDAKLKVSAAVLNVNATEVTSGEAGVKWGPVEIGGSAKKSETQSLTLALGDGEDEAESNDMNAKRDLRKELKEAIVAIGKAARVAAQGTDALTVAAGIIEFKFGVEKEGKIKVGVGIGHNEAAVHSLKLTLKAV